MTDRDEDELALLVALEDAGRIDSERARGWSSMAELLAVFEAIGREGPSATIKIDGGRRPANVYTVLVSGGPLGDDYIRRDGDHLPTLLTQVIAQYRDRVWAAQG